MIAGTTAYVYNNTRCKHLARHIVEQYGVDNKANRHDFYTICRNALIIKLNVQPQRAVHAMRKPRRERQHNLSTTLNLINYMDLTLIPHHKM